MAGVADFRPHLQWGKNGGGSESCIVAGGDLAAPREPPRQLTQLTGSQRALNVGDSIVVAEPLHFVVPGAGLRPLPKIGADAVIAEASHSPSQMLIVGRNHATFPGGDVLDRMKAER